jgi:hypothetical protein
MAATASSTQPAGFVALSRVVVSVAADLVAGVERAVAGDGRVRTAQGNAWDAIQADRARAQARDEMTELVASLLANEPRRGGGRRHNGARKASLMGARTNSSR